MRSLRSDHFRPVTIVGEYFQQHSNLVYKKQTGCHVGVSYNVCLHLSVRNDGPYGVVHVNIVIAKYVRIFKGRRSRKLNTSKIH